MILKIYPPLKACIFDLDGVIIDTTKYHFEAWRKLARSVGTDFSKAQNELLKGVSRKESLNLILQWGGIHKSEEEQQVLCDQKNTDYLSFIEKLDEDDAMPGVRTILEEILALNIQLGLGSASTNAVAILDKLDLTKYFTTIIDGNKVRCGKPDPETFLKACTDLDVDPSQTIVFEDALKGIQAAKTGGMYAIGVGQSEDLPGADFVIPGFVNQSIREMVKQLPLSIDSVKPTDSKSVQMK